MMTSLGNDVSAVENTSLKMSATAKNRCRVSYESVMHYKINAIMCV